MPKKKPGISANLPATKTGAVNVQINGDGSIDLRALEREVSLAHDEPGYEYWAGESPWTLEQAVALLLRKNPFQIAAYPEQLERLGTVVLMLRTALAPLFDHREFIPPESIIKRADERGIPVVPELRKAVEAQSLKQSSKDAEVSRLAHEAALAQKGSPSSATEKQQYYAALSRATKIAMRFIWRR